MKHPLQNTFIDESGLLRFVENDVVVLMLKLLKTHGVGLNELHEAGGDISEEDWDQFNQLIGYSVGMAPISDALRDIARARHASGRPVEEVRAEQAEELLQRTRLALREGLAGLYGIHPDSLMEVDVHKEPQA